VADLAGAYAAEEKGIGRESGDGASAHRPQALESAGVMVGGPMMMLRQSLQSAQYARTWQQMLIALALVAGGAGERT
jgi:hypothetical protein